MQNFLFDAKDVHWVYSEQTGAIPFILNVEKTKVKQLEDGFILEILEKDKCSNPLTAAKKTFEGYYEMPMEYVNHTAMFAHVNMFQNLQWFMLQDLDARTIISTDQIEFLTKNYNRKISKTRRKESIKKAKREREYAEREREKAEREREEAERAKSFYF